MTDGNTEGTSPNGGDSVETTRQRLLQTIKAYLLGALHDATERKLTYRISQKNRDYPTFIKDILKSVDIKAWVYQEGKNRDVYVVEFSKAFLKGFQIKTPEEKKYFIRGYFDSEGGIAKEVNVNYYIYFAQKDKNDLEKVKIYLEEFKIICGKTHNPSFRVDPNYWRFYISSKSYLDFANKIGSWHPEKSRLLRMKI